MGANDSWIYQGRQAHGWFGSGTAPSKANGAAANESSGTEERIHAVISATVAELPAAQRRIYERHLNTGTREKLAAAMKGWVEGARLDAETFRVRYFGPWSSATPAKHLQNAAAAIARGDPDYAGPQAAPAEMAAAVQQIGTGNWARFVADARERAAAAPPLALLHESPTPPDANVHKARELLLSPKPPALFADSPKQIVPRYMERIPRQSGKEAASDTPSYARGVRRYVGETPDAYAERVMDNEWGKGNWEEDARRQAEFRKIKKYGARAFRDPRSVAPAEKEDRPAAEIPPQQSPT